MTQQAERRRDRTSFQELAKLAQTPPPPSVTDSATGGPLSSPASGPAASSPLVWPSAPNVNAGPWSGADSDSGMVDLKAISQPAPVQQERARTTPLAAEGLFEDAPAAPAAAAPAAASVVPQPSSAAPMPTSAVAAVPSTAPVQAVPAVSGLIEIPAPRPMPEEKSRAGVIVGVIAGFAAIAAGAFFFISSSHKKADAVAMAPVAAETKQVATPAATQAPPVAPAATVADQPVAAASAAPAEEPVAVAAKSNGRPHAKSKAAGDKEPAAPPAVAAPEAAKEPPPAKVASKGGAMDLKGAMENAVGPDGKPKAEMAPAVDTSVRGTQPKPSQGQVQGAIGAVLMKARECLGPDDAVSKANVVFGSDGAVQSVSVSGGAAGKPAEACIKGALGKAKVPAFADPTYSFPVTVRPL